MNINGEQIRNNTIILNTKVVPIADYEFITLTGSTVFALSNKTISEYNAATGSVLVNKNYLEERINANGLTVMDEGVTVSNAVIGINFIGASVLAEDSATLNRYINVFIPSPNYAADFNTANTQSSTNGTNALVYSNLNGISTSLRTTRNRPSTEQPSLNNGLAYNVDTIRWSVGNNVIYGSEPFTIDHPTNNELYLQVIKGGDNTILAASTCSLSSSLTYSQGLTNSIINEFKIPSITSEINRWRAGFTASINYQNAYAIAGATGGMQIYTRIINKRATQRFTYSNISTNINNNAPNVWLDRELATASISAITISQINLITKPLSGVNYITTNSVFSVDVSAINNINNGSFPTNFIELNLGQYLMSTQYATPSMLTGWTSSFTNINSNLTKTYSIASTNNSTVNNSAIVSVRPIDWAVGSWVNSVTNAIAIDTLSAVPTRIYDDFTTEMDSNYPRLQNDLVSPWVSTTVLGSIDSGNGLQLSQSRLIYPTVDYTTFIPTNTANYASFTGTRVYRRKMYSGNDATTFGNGVFTFSDTNITEAMLASSDLLFEVGDGTNWFTLNNSYTSGALSNGNGCRINSSNSNLTNVTKTLSFTLGVLNLHSIYLKISYTSTTTGKSIYIGSITLNW